MSRLFVVLCLASVGLAIVPDKDRIMFDRYVQKYGKTYADEADRRAHFVAFKQKMRFVETFNADRAADGVFVGLNELSDLTPEESAARRVPPRQSLAAAAAEMSAPADISGLPASVDWRTKGVVGPVVDQGQCGSAGIYAGVDAITSCHAIATGKLDVLSVAQAIDCVTSGGCNGGADATSVFAYVQANGGIDTEVCYPTPVGHCAYEKSCCASQLKNYTIITSGNEHALQAAVAMSPVAAGIDASHASFEMYQGGIYYEPACSSTQIDHTILIVGYGSQNGQDYWIGKNSWGASWGVNGYILLARNRNNNCGVASFVAVPHGCPACAGAAQAF